MMNRNNSATSNNKLSLSALFANNKIVFVFSVFIAIICWVLVSMSQTTEVEKVFQDVRVNINIDESIAKNNGLEIFGNKEFSVDVRVKGLSYIVNDSSFSNDNISVTASCSAVVAAGTYDLPLSASVVGASGQAEVVDISLNSIKVYFDERMTKSFALTEEVEELDGYSIADELVRENPRLSVEKIVISGPAREISKITAVKAHVELSKELTSSVSLEAEIITESSSGEIDSSLLTYDLTEPVYVSIPVKKVGKYVTAVDFIGIPQAYRGEGIDYSVYPSEIDVSYITGTDDTQLNESNEILIGTIDFSDINNTVNRIVINNEDISSDVNNFTVTIDMSDMAKRWMEIPVDVSTAKLPDNVTVLSKTVESVQIIGPGTTVMNIDQSAAYAVPVIDGAELAPGKHIVPAKIILRTLTDSWVHGTYEIEIEVK